jgi:hypothetical protein
MKQDQAGQLTADRLGDQDGRLSAGHLDGQGGRFPGLRVRAAQAEHAGDRVPVGRVAGHQRRGERRAFSVAEQRQPGLRVEQVQPDAEFFAQPAEHLRPRRPAMTDVRSSSYSRATRPGTRASSRPLASATARATAVNGTL